MLTPHQYQHAWYTITRPEEGHLHIQSGFDKKAAQEVCEGYWLRGEECTVGYGLQRCLIGDE